MPTKLAEKSTIPRNIARSVNTKTNSSNNLLFSHLLLLVAVDRFMPGQSWLGSSPPEEPPHRPTSSHVGSSSTAPFPPHSPPSLGRPRLWTSLHLLGGPCILRDVFSIRRGVLACKQTNGILLAPRCIAPNPLCCFARPGRRLPLPFKQALLVRRTLWCALSRAGGNNPSHCRDDRRAWSPLLSVSSAVCVTPTSVCTFFFAWVVLSSFSLFWSIPCSEVASRPARATLFPLGTVTSEEGMLQKRPKREKGMIPEKESAQTDVRATQSADETESRGLQARRSSQIVGGIFSSRAKESTPEGAPEQERLLQR